MSIYIQKQVVWCNPSAVPGTYPHKNKNSVYTILSEYNDSDIILSGKPDEDDTEFFVEFNDIKHPDDVVCCPRCGETSEVYQPTWFNPNDNSANNNNAGMEGLSDYCETCRDTISLISLSQYMENQQELSKCCQEDLPRMQRCDECGNDWNEEFIAFHETIKSNLCPNCLVKLDNEINTYEKENETTPSIPVRSN